MTLRTNRVMLAALLISAVWPAAAWAQFGRGWASVSAIEGAGRPAISASGAATVQRDPTQLRLYIQILAKGKTLEDALAKLKDRREAATAQLEALKADKKSIVFGSPSLSNSASARKQQIEAMVMDQMMSRGKKAAKGLQAPQTVTVSATLTAQWPLKPESPDKLLLLSQGIEEKIKAADLAGGKEAEKLAPEEQELEEEAAAQMANRYGQQEQQPGQPQFVFVATLPKEDREKAMTEAFANAKKQAAELAKAAGVELGPLIGLSGHCGGQSNFGGFEGYDPSGQSQFLRQMVAQQTGEDPDAKQDEAMGTDPGKLKFVCYATVLFQVGK
jgi:hypothetical protein